MFLLGKECYVEFAISLLRISSNPFFLWGVLHIMEWSSSYQLCSLLRKVPSESEPSNTPNIMGKGETIPYIILNLWCVVDCVLWWKVRNMEKQVKCANKCFGMMEFFFIFG